MSIAIFPHALSVSLSNMTSSNGNIGIGITNPLQQLEVSGNAIFHGSVSTQNMGMFRNRIINGDMRINQRGASSALIPVNSSPTYLIDRFWGMNGSLNNAMTQNQLTLSTSDLPNGYGFTNCYQAITTTAYSGNGVFGQTIEGVNISDFMWGSTSGIPITISMWVKSSYAGMSSIYVRSSNTPTPYGTPYCYGVQYTIVAANTWQNVTVTIPPPPVSSAWTTLMLVYGASAWGGTSTPNVWTCVGNGGGYCSTGDVYLAYANVGSYFSVTGIQLEKGTIATPFEFRPLQIEMSLCQRYYQTLPAQTFAGYFGNSLSAQVTCPLQTIMRAPPTCTPIFFYTSGMGSWSTTGNTMTSISANVFKAGSVLSGTAVGAGTVLTISGDNSSYTTPVTFNAEL